MRRSAANATNRYGTIHWPIDWNSVSDTKDYMSNESLRRRPRVSVIMPVYNSRRFLDQAVHSVLGQTERDIELIIIDDGSDDDVAKNIDSLSKTDARILVVHKTNGGPSSARNVGLLKAQGEFIAFIDSDDFMAPDMLEVMANSAEANMADAVRIERFDVIKGNVRTVPSTRTTCMLSAPDDLIELIKDMCSQREAPFVWQHLFRRETISGVPFPTDCSFGEDLLFLVQAFAGIERLQYLATPHYFYRHSEGSITRSPANTKENLIGQAEVSARVAEMMETYPGATASDSANIATDRLLAMMRSHIRKISAGEIGRGDYVEVWERIKREGSIDILSDAGPSLPGVFKQMFKLVQYGRIPSFWYLARLSVIVMAPRDLIKSLRESRSRVNSTNGNTGWALNEG